MRIKTLSVALLAGAIIGAGCGGDDSESTTASADSAPETIADIEFDAGPFDSDEDFVAAVNDYCGTTSEIFARYPVYGVGADGLADEFETTVRLDQEDLANVESFEAPDDLADEWDGYLEANTNLVAAHEDVLAAAEQGDLDKANGVLFGPATDAIDAVTKASEDLGIECFQEEVDLSEADPATASDAAADAPQPSNSIEEAGDEWLAALQSGDCKEIVAATHAQNYPTVESVADPTTGDCKGAKTNSAESEVVGSTQFGPVGMVAYRYAPGQYQYDEFIIDRDNDDELKHTTTIYAGPTGLDPAPEGNDADAKVEAFVNAIRDNDADALNQSLTVETLPPGEESSFAQDGPFDALGNDPTYAKQIVSDIREDAEAEPVPLGANQIWSTYLLDTTGEDYVLLATHQPGSEDEYGANAYWVLPAS